jgi:hypothetical protein
MRKLIAIGLMLCILLTVLVSGASAGTKKDKAFQGTISLSNNAYATASSANRPSYVTATTYTQVGIDKKGINAVGATQASASGDSASVYSSQSLVGFFSIK